MRASFCLLAAATLVAGLSACSQDSPPAASHSTLTISGRTDALTFAAPVSTIRAMRAGAVAAEAPVGADGRFALAVPQGTGYELAFAYSNGSATLVFPRKAGTIEHRFDVTGAGAFDLGLVRHVGDPAKQAFKFSTAAAALNASGAAGEGDDGECENGIDAATGAVCVDDDEEELAGMCGGEESGEENDAEEAGGVDCVDGIDAATGAECDGGPAANQDDGEEGGEEGDHEEAGGVDCVDGIDAATGAECDGGPAANQDDGEEAMNDAAVAEHNLPAAVGCAEAEGDEAGGVDCEDGIDKATGAWCDGGPAANQAD